MLSGRLLGPDDHSDKTPVVLHSGLQDMREKVQNPDTLATWEICNK